MVKQPSLREAALTPRNNIPNTTSDDEIAKVSPNLADIKVPSAIFQSPNIEVLRNTSSLAKGTGRHQRKRSASDSRHSRL
ncbi:hypothetical protein FQN53_006227 [Emmonsiellopsis sp. PD_33]|nr:hypothetical protein FQN53_006227 [Emmonsiellopsis sp. PD_33]